MGRIKVLKARAKSKVHSVSFCLKIRARIVKLKFRMRRWKRIQKGDFKEAEKIRIRLATGELDREKRARLAQRFRVLNHRSAMWDRDIKKASNELMLIQAQLREFNEM
ncbi:MAG: hypothetical protein PHH08_02655 [Candidatus ainarchaeum sp.]|nr:hypothetical protein [Candidatus ainarchaeum sp.]